MNAQTGPPRFSIFTQGSAYNSQTEIARLGYLSGWTVHDVAEYGFGFGDANHYATYDPTNGLSIKGSITIENPGDINTSDLTNGAGWTVGATWGTDLNSIPTRLADTPGGAGLYLSSDHLGYYNGSTWQTYMDNSGLFYLTGADSSDYLTWNPATNSLSITGSITIENPEDISELWDLYGADGQVVVDSHFDKTAARVAALNDSGGWWYSTSTTEISICATCGPDSDTALQMTSNASSNVIVYASRPGTSVYDRAFRKNDVAVFRFRAKFSADYSGALYAEIPELDASGTVLSWTAATITTNTSATWDWFTVAIQATNADCRSVRFGFMRASAGAGTAYITDVSIEINRSTTADGLVSMPAVPAGGGLYLGSNYLGYHDGANWTTYMDSNGDFYLAGASDNYFQWDASTETLTAAGWTFNAAAIIKDTGVAATSAGMSPADYPFYAGQTYANRASAPFRVTPAGYLYASNANISGTLTSSAGTIGNFTLSSLYLTSPSGMRLNADQDRIDWNSGSVYLENKYSGIYAYPSLNTPSLSVSGSVDLYTGGLFGTTLSISSTIAKVTGKLWVTDETELDGSLNHDGSYIGFFGTAPAAQQTVTGSRGANAALASLLTALANYGIIVDSST